MAPMKGSWVFAFWTEMGRGRSRGILMTWAPCKSSSKKFCQSVLQYFVRSTALKPISNKKNFLKKKEIQGSEFPSWLGGKESD